LAYPKLDDAQRCDLTLAKAESEMQASLPAEALESFRQGKALCRLDADQAYAARAASVLSGDGGPEAVSMVQGHRMPGDEMTLVEWREKSRGELAKRMKTRPRDLPEEKWSAVHASGASYTVTLSSGRDTVLTAEVDLFAQKIKVDIHVQ
ncbi:MAG: hypothetical protein HYV15_00505, partial [Elusimicrobia bacterium]|nr:hypothetical protein [Elusimicrobiota bacterium]